MKPDQARRPKFKQERQSRPPLDPDPAVVAGLAFAGIAAVGSLTTALVHVLNRIDVVRARRKSTHTKLAKWGQVAKELTAELGNFAAFIQRVQPQPESVPIIGTSLKLSASDALVYRNLIARLSKLAKDATVLSLDLTELLTGEAERRAWYASRKFEQLAKELPQLVEQQNQDLANLWGSKGMNEFLERGQRVLNTLTRFEGEIQRSLEEE